MNMSKIQSIDPFIKKTKLCDFFSHISRIVAFDSDKHSQITNYFKHYFDKLPTENIIFYEKGISLNAQEFVMNCFNMTTIHFNIEKVMTRISNNEIPYSLINVKDNISNIVYSYESSMPQSFDKDTIICVPFPLCDYSGLASGKYIVIEGNKRMSYFVNNKHNLNFDIKCINALYTDIRCFTDLYSHFVFLYVSCMFYCNEIPLDAIEEVVNISIENLDILNHMQLA